MNWDVNDFHRRWYHYDQDEKQKELDRARRVSFQVSADGRKLIDMELREPGIIALISRPDDDGFMVEVVEPGARKYNDVAVMAQIDTSILPWQQQLLFEDES